MPSVVIVQTDGNIDHALDGFEGERVADEGENGAD